MRIKNNREPIKSLEFASLTDIVLNMFIFFFISFSLLYTFNAQSISRINVQLPKAGNVVALDKLKKLTITVNESGEFYLNDKRKNKKELKSELERASRQDPDTSIMIISDKKTEFKFIVEVLDMLSGLGINNLSIAALQDKG